MLRSIALKSFLDCQYKHELRFYFASLKILISVIVFAVNIFLFNFDPNTYSWGFPTQIL